MKDQITSNILMIRPVNFRYNEETAKNNYYQKVIEGLTPERAQLEAEAEFDRFVDKLREKGVMVTVIPDNKSPDTPDSIFPNNWISFHQDGKVGLYPMYAVSRRGERRQDIIDTLSEQFVVKDIIDFTKHESSNEFLEGTGSLVLDRPNSTAYAAISERTDPLVLEEFCKSFGYQAVSFTANQLVDGTRMSIYHTNVMMCVANDFAVICLDSIDDRQERNTVVESLKSSGKEVIDITEDQVHHFAGNMLQVLGTNNQPYLVMSSAAYHSLQQDQLDAIKKHCSIIHSSLDTIEACGGGSARCMMAEVFLPERK